MAYYVNFLTLERKQTLPENIHSIHSKSDGILMDIKRLYLQLIRPDCFEQFLCTICMTWISPGLPLSRQNKLSEFSLTFLDKLAIRNEKKYQSIQAFEKWEKGLCKPQFKGYGNNYTVLLPKHIKKFLFPWLLTFSHKSGNSIFHSCTMGIRGTLKKINRKAYVCLSSYQHI